MMSTEAEATAITDLGPDATGADLYRAGLACSTGQGAPLSYVEAHKWFNLAALAGVQEAKVYRRELAELMSSAEIAAAQESARMWMTAAVHGRRPTPAKRVEAKPVEAKPVEAAPVEAKRVVTKRAPATARARVAA
jgi:TPR repeat protein